MLDTHIDYEIQQGSELVHVSPLSTVLSFHCILSNCPLFEQDSPDFWFKNCCCSTFSTLAQAQLISELNGSSSFFVPA